jgi:hypothetical protein
MRTGHGEHTLDEKGFHESLVRSPDVDPKLRSRPVPSSLELVTCPECRAAAEVGWREVADSTAGPVEHVKIRCLERHWFLMPAEALVPR